MILTNINGIPIYKREILNLPSNKSLNSDAKRNRKIGNLPEVLFWNEVKNNKFYSIDFDRQKVIGNYIVDFFINELGLVIEIDGESHRFSGEKDIERQMFLESLGLKVYRLNVISVKKNIDYVLKSLADYIILEFGKVKN